MSAEREAIIRKIQKMQAHAQNAEAIGNIAEAENYAAGASRLMEQYRLSMTEVEFATYLTTDQVGEHDVDWEQYGMRRKFGQPRWIFVMAKAVSNANGCDVLIGKVSNRVVVIGRPHACKVTEYTLIVLVRAGERMVAAKVESRWRQEVATLEAFVGKIPRGMKAAQTRDWKESWLNGYAAGIIRRLQSDHASQPDGTTALMRTQADTSHAKAYIKSRGVKMRDIDIKPKMASAYAAGYDAADTVNLNSRGIEHTSRPVPALAAGQKAGEK